MLAPAGALAGDWGAHGAYLGGELIHDAFSHPKNGAVIAAGATESITSVPGKIGNAVDKYVFSPAMGPQDELSPLERSLRRGVATVGPASGPPERFWRSRPENALGDGMHGWSVPYIKGGAVNGPADAVNASPSTRPFISSRVPAVPYVPQAPQETSGGIPGLIADTTGSASSAPSQFQPAAGGLLGMIQEYMRNNPAESGGR